jgi:hypothetical protein
MVKWMIPIFNHLLGGTGVHFGRLIPYPILPVGSDEATDEPLHGVDMSTATLRERIRFETGPTRGQRVRWLLRSLTPIGT